MSLKDKGNAWKLVYAALIMVENVPEIQEGYIEDEEGNLQNIAVPCNPKDLKLNIKNKQKEEIEFWEIRLSEALYTFVYEYEKGKINPPFTYESYLNNDNIKDTLEAYGLDVEQFWYAILAVYWLTQIRCVNVIKPEGSIGEQMQKLSEYMQGIDSFTIIAEGKRSLQLTMWGLLNLFVNFLTINLLKMNLYLITVIR